MSKPIKTEAELLVMARAELKAHLDAPEGRSIAVVRDGASWSFARTPMARPWPSRAIPQASPYWCRSATISAGSMM